MLTIAGVTGRIGGAVAGALLARGNAVRALVRRPEAAARWTSRGAEVCVVDLADEAGLTRALRGTTGLFALLPEDVSAHDFHGQRLRIAGALAAAVRAARVPHVVLLSSIAAPLAAGPPRDLRHAEDALAATGCTLTTIRAAFFQDNIAAGLAPARERGLFPSLFPSPDAALPMVATADVAALVAACLREPPARSEIVDLIGPIYSIAQAAGELGRAIGRAVEVVTIPPADQPGFLADLGLPAPFAASLVEMYARLGAERPALQGRRAVTGATTLAQTLSALTRGARPVDRTTIPAVVAALTDAWNRHDLVAMGELYRADADFVNIFGGHLQGRDEIVREHTLRHQVMFAAARMASAAPAIRSLGPTLALARVAWTMRGITAPDGSPAPDRRGLMLHVLEQIAGAWWIVTTQNTELAQAAPQRFLDLAAS